MGFPEAAILVAIIAVVVVVVRMVARRMRPDGPAGRGPYSSSAETTAGLAAFGVTRDHADADLGGGWDGGGADGGGD
jgi:hypothetical protein